MSGRDIRYGRSGGRWLPAMSAAAEAAAFAAAVEAGEIVRGECLCSYWWLVAVDVGSICGHCGEPRRAASPIRARGDARG